MQFVYRLDLNDCIYIGTTNNIRRRKDQHNGKGRDGKSKLGEYLHDHGIVLTIDDFTILGTFETRKEAFEFERKTTIELAAKGENILNDNYSLTCSRKGKNIGITAKDFIVVDYINHSVTPVHDLRQYCLSKGWDNRLVHRTIHGGYCNKYGCVAFRSDDWEREPDKEKYISGLFISELKKERTDSRVKKQVKRYEVQFPDGHCEIVENADRFAREHGLTPGTFHATLIKNRPTKGYQILRRI